MLLSMNIQQTIDSDQKLQIASLYQPVELQLDQQLGLKVVQQNRSAKELQPLSDKEQPLLKQYRKKIKYRTQLPNSPKDEQYGRIWETTNQQIDKGLRNDVNLVHQGLLSVLYGEANNVESTNKIHAMVCVTMYKEPLTELQKSINGIISNLSEFAKHGIAPHQIAVVVMFDGIENIHNTLDESGASYHDDIIPYFRTNMDKVFGIDQKQTLEYQHQEYRLHVKRFSDYTKDNLTYLRKNKELLLAKFKKHQAALRTTLRKLKDDQVQPEDEWIEDNLIDAMAQQYQESKEYLQSRANTSWVYQTRHKYTLIDSQTGSMPIFYVFKFANGSKLSSHLWFFNGFCKIIKPKYCVLMDGGAKPMETSIFKLISSMEADSKLGGVCGTMHIEEESESVKDDPMDIISKLLNKYIFSIQKCQSCEYEIGHILDKQYESALNYIHVLPGAFSAYRYEALLKRYHSNQDNNILDIYLKQVMDPNYEYKDIQEANMYLAEDRVLCLLLFCNGYYLRYIPDAHVTVDACKTLIDLMNQRRRWINGSWFALNYVTANYTTSLEQSNHSTIDKAAFQFSIVSAKIGQFTQYLFQSFQIIWIYMILTAVVNSGDILQDKWIVSGLLTLYILSILMLVFLAITFNPSIIRSIHDKEQQKQIQSYYYSKYYAISSVLGLVNLGVVIYTIYLIIYEVIMQVSVLDFLKYPDVPQSYYSLLIIISFGMNTFPFILAIFVSPKNVINITLNAVHYIYYQPTYTNLFQIYAFCRIDDLSWGTKGLTIDNSTQRFRQDKTYMKYLFVAQWMLTNAFISGIILVLFQLNVFLLVQCLILALALFVTILSIIKGCLSVVYFIKFTCSYQNTRKNQEIQSQQGAKLKVETAIEQHKKQLDTYFQFNV